MANPPRIDSLISSPEVLNPELDDGADAVEPFSDDTKFLTPTKGWIVRRGHSMLGPYTDQQVSRYLLLGRIRHNDRLSADGQCWRPVTDFPFLIPEELRAIDSDQGWMRYLDALAEIDERGELGERRQSLRDGSIDRRITASREQFRNDWREALDDAGLSGGDRRFLPYLLIGVTLAVLLVLIALNSFVN